MIFIGMYDMILEGREVLRGISISILVKQNINVWSSHFTEGSFYLC